MQYFLVAHKIVMHLTVHVLWVRSVSCYWDRLRARPDMEAREPAT